LPLTNDHEFSTSPPPPDQIRKGKEKHKNPVNQGYLNRGHIMMIKMSHKCNVYEANERGERRRVGRPFQIVRAANLKRRQHIVKHIYGACSRCSFEECNSRVGGFEHEVLLILYGASNFRKRYRFTCKLYH